MPVDPDSELPTLSRRSVLGLLGLAPIAGSGLLTGCRTSNLPDTGPSTSTASEPAVIPADLLPGGRLDRFVADQAAKGEFSGNVLLAQRGQPVLTTSHGMANQERSIPNGEGTVFSLGSVSKVFTAVAVAQLAQQGELAFDKTLGTYLDGFPAEIADTVTVHQLLTHTSGIGKPPVQQGPPPQPSPQPPTTLDERLAAELAGTRRMPLQFAPGTRYAYSNDGFIVLGAIVAEVSGRSYFDYVREHVFSPAGMTRSEFLTGRQVLERADIAHGYLVPPNGRPVDSSTLPQFEASATATPAGGCFSTASDLLGFATALQNGRLLEPDYVELVTRGKVPSDGVEATTQLDSSSTAYGVTDSVLRGKRIVSKTGGSTLGTVAHLDIFPEMGWVAVILTNVVRAPEPGRKVDYAEATRMVTAWLGPVVERERDIITQQGA